MCVFGHKLYYECFSFYILLFWEAPLLRHKGAFHILWMHFIVTKTDKFIWYSQTAKELYFDLVNDPHESHNAIDEEQNTILAKYVIRQKGK